MYLTWYEEFKEKKLLKKIFWMTNVKYEKKFRIEENVIVQWFDIYFTYKSCRVYINRQQNTLENKINYREHEWFIMIR